MVRRIFVEKIREYDLSSRNLEKEILDILKIETSDVRIFTRYDIQDIDEGSFNKSLNSIFSEPPVDMLYKEDLPQLVNYEYIVVEYQDGQYDQRADSAMQCVQLLSLKERPLIKCATIYAIKGITKRERLIISDYLINPVESKEGSMEKLEKISQEYSVDNTIRYHKNFKDYKLSMLKKFHKQESLAMSIKDLKFVQEYFKGIYRDPTHTELKVIDTYWSDHCRHTTFNTKLTNIKVLTEDKNIKRSLRLYNKLFEKHYSNRPEKYKSLMSIATIAVKELISQGYLSKIDISEEINACSINAEIEVDGKKEDYLIMFKNETHNHPTEIEPFGGAATCLGGAIRDPLSGRVYVYQAMRVTGCADVSQDYKDTMPGKLPQRVITQKAAQGYSSYGNQIGIATGQVSETYHDSYVAKRLETGFVIGAAPKENIVRKTPKNGDIVILLGGKTGRDGCGGATGSSKSHDDQSVINCGAEVQKGNPPEERKIQRLFRDKSLTQKIIRCNDFGAGGVSVAIGELADSLDIYLDKVPKKYKGLTPTEIAISESQERMAIVVDSSDVDLIINKAYQENIEATVVAKITDTGKMRMYLNDELVVDLSRAFLQTNGVVLTKKVEIQDKSTDYFNNINKDHLKGLKGNEKELTIANIMGQFNVCSQRGLVEMFDSTISTGTVILPLGGKYQITPSVGMVAKVPTLQGHSSTTTISTHAFYPELYEKSPYYGAIYSVLSSISKVVALGGKSSDVYLTFQEYFEKLTTNKSWGLPTSALLGALDAQINFKVGAIGGKDSMSGTFNDINVVPTLISFAVCISNIKNATANVFKYKQGANNIYHIPLKRNSDGYPNYKSIINTYKQIEQAIEKGEIISCSVVEKGGLLASTIKSALGNRVGINISYDSEALIKDLIGDFVIQASSSVKITGKKKIASINKTNNLVFNGDKISYDVIQSAYTKKYDNIFPYIKEDGYTRKPIITLAHKSKKIYKSTKFVEKPIVFMPIFPGTNCEYDMALKFEKAGATVKQVVIKNFDSKSITESINEIKEAIDNCNIIAFPGGFSGGDEPDGSGKFIATTFRNKVISDAVTDLLENRDGLIIGICNGFQALIKLGLLPYGKITEQNDTSPTLTFNKLNRHISTVTNIKISSDKSPWFANVKVGDQFKNIISHGEGRVVIDDKKLDKLINNGQIATQYVNLQGNATMNPPYNPNGSAYAIEGLLSPDGRILGKMGHSERVADGLYKNHDGDYELNLFKSGVEYFKNKSK